VFVKTVNSNAATVVINYGGTAAFADYDSTFAFISLFLGEKPIEVGLKAHFLSTLNAKPGHKPDSLGFRIDI
jgi:hypothetical protein